MTERLEQKLEWAIWVGKALFDRGKATGSSANMSFIHNGLIYITASGTCFGRLTDSDFSVVTMEGELIEGRKPSKEFPLHKSLFKKEPSIQAVLHTHSFYSTLWSCLKHENEKDIIPQYTPYLRMQIGTIGLVPYAKPGTQELFDRFEECLSDSDGYILKNHGSIVGQTDMLKAFYCLEELEESARLAWELRNEESSELI